MHLPTQIELRRVEQLLPCARNSRIHSDEQVGQMAASIREFWLDNPVLVGADARRIRHDGVRPNYGSKRKAS